MNEILAPLFGNVNSAACCETTSDTHNPPMEKSKKSKILPVHEEESAKLKALFNQRISLSQADFGAEYGIGSQGMVWQYLNAKSPLNLEAALKFAKGLSCEIAEFSPRLAAPLAGQPQPKGEESRAEAHEGHGIAATLAAGSVVVAAAAGGKSASPTVGAIIKKLASMDDSHPVIQFLAWELLEGGKVEADPKIPSSKKDVSDRMENLGGFLKSAKLKIDKK